MDNTNCIFSSTTLLLISVLLECQSQFVTTPQNTWVYQGQPVTLECTIQNAGETNKGYVQAWKEYITDPRGRVIASDDTSFDESKYDVTGQFNLHIKTAELSDGGMYSCADVVVRTVEYFVELVVLESDQVVLSLSPGPFFLENSVISYTCQMTYGGNIKPKLEWTTPVQTDTSSIDIAIVSLNITASASYNGIYFLCRSYFEDVTSGFPYKASNSLAYSHVVQTDTLEVHYAPRDTQIVDSYDYPIYRNAYISPGTKLRCRTNSNPPPEKYEWRNTKDFEILSTEPIYSVSSDLVGSVLLECLVVNYVGQNRQLQGTDSVRINFYVAGNKKTGQSEVNGTDDPENEDTGISTTTIIGIAVGVGLVLLIIIVILLIAIFLVLRRKSAVSLFRKPSKPEVEPEEDELRAAGIGPGLRSPIDGGFREYLTNRDKRPKRVLHYPTNDPPPPPYEIATNENGYMSRTDPKLDKMLLDNDINRFLTGDELPKANGGRHIGTTTGGNGMSRGNEILL